MTSRIGVPLQIVVVLLLCAFLPYRLSGQTDHPADHGTDAAGQSLPATRTQALPSETAARGQPSASFVHPPGLGPALPVEFPRSPLYLPYATGLPSFDATSYAGLRPYGSDFKLFGFIDQRQRVTPYQAWMSPVPVLGNAPTANRPSFLPVRDGRLIDSNSALIGGLAAYDPGLMTGYNTRRFDVSGSDLHVPQQSSVVRLDPDVYSQSWRYSSVASPFAPGNPQFSRPAVTGSLTSPVVDSAAASTIAGDAAMVAGDYRSAAAAYSRAIVLAGREADLRFRRATALFAAGSFDEAAVEMLAGAERLKLGELPTCRLQAVISDDGLLQRRLQALQHLVDGRETAQRRFLLGYVEYSSGRYDIGLSHLRRATELSPESPVPAAFTLLLQHAAERRKDGAKPVGGTRRRDNP